MFFTLGTYCACTILGKLDPNELNVPYPLVVAMFFVTQDSCGRLIHDERHVFSAFAWNYRLKIVNTPFRCL